MTQISQIELMGSKSNIEWTEASWNPVVGCTKVSEGCRHCYAMTMAARIANASRATVGIGGRGTERQAGYAAAVQWNGDKALPQWSNAVVTLPSALGEPLGWRRPRRVFVNSMSDLFHEDVPFEFVDRVFAVMALCPQHTFQVLTKRPERMVEYFDYPINASRVAYAAGRIAGESGNAALMEFGDALTKQWAKVGNTAMPLPNVWLGTSCEDQAALEARLPHLRACPAAVRWLSVEPQIEDIEWRAEHATGIHWIVFGGESGPNARAYYVDWAERGLRFCMHTGRAAFLKQLGSRPMLGDVSHPQGWPIKGGPVNWETGAIHLRSRKGGDPSEWPEHLRVRQFPAAAGAP